MMSGLSRHGSATQWIGVAWAAFYIFIVVFMTLEYLSDDSTRDDVVLTQPKSKSHLMTHTNIPRTLYQTWKTEKVPKWAQRAVQSWDSMNPSYRHLIMGDKDIDELVHKSHPDMLEAFDQMKPIQKADLFRYLILMDNGGLYADLDVECKRPIDKWVEQYRPRDFYTSKINFVVGFEIVTDAKAVERHDFATEFQFSQWSMASIPNHPILQNVKMLIREYFKQQKHLNSTSIVRSTGPGIWSDAIALHLKQAYGVILGDGLFNHKRMNEKGARIGNILILPTRAFGLGSAGLTLHENESQEDVLIKHNFKGTWKKKK